MHSIKICINFLKSDILEDFRVYERNSYPATSLVKDKTNIIFSYGSKFQKHSEYLIIHIDLSNKLVSIERDQRSTLILWYYWNKKTLIISTSYQYLLDNINNLSINKSYLLNFLYSGSNQVGTLYQDIKFLEPSSTYIFSNKNCKIIKHKIKHQIEPINIDFEDILIKNLSNLMPENRVAAEISGGLDSAFLPVLTKKSSFFPFLIATGQKHIGSVGQIQEFTLNKLQEFLNIPFEYVLLDKSTWPFDDSSINKIEHPETEIYQKSLLKEIDILKKHNINTVFEGFGGDEMFEIRRNWSNQRKRINKDILEFYQSIYTDEFFNELKTTKITRFKDYYFPESFYLSLVSRHAFFTDNGIWPITPYRDYDIYIMFQNFKIDKQTFFKSFYYNFDKSLTGIFDKNTNMVEYFREFFVSTHFEKYLNIALKSKLLKNYVKWSKVLSAYKNIKVNRVFYSHQIFTIYKIVRIGLMTI